MKAVWSYCIYGYDHTRYYFPVVSNIQSARMVNALVVISTTEQFKSSVQEYFNSYLNEIVIISCENKSLSSFPKMLRFLISKKIDADYYFFKDSDSIVTNREMQIMQDWMILPKPRAMILRDHPMHVAPIMAGMFGLSKCLAENLADHILNDFFTNSQEFDNPYSYDQDWLMTDFYPKINHIADVYSSFLFYSNENLHRIEREVCGSKFIGAQSHAIYAKTVVELDFFSFYGSETLCAPSVLAKTAFYGKVRPTITIAFIYTRIIKFFKKLFPSICRV